LTRRPTRTRARCQSGKTAGREKIFGETPFGGRFAHPESFWCYAHQTAPKVSDLWNPIQMRYFLLDV